MTSTSLGSSSVSVLWQRHRSCRMRKDRADRSRRGVRSDQRRLILTHTHAGVDALTKRLRKHQAPTAKYRIATIAGWCLRFAASFPQRSGIVATAPTTSAEWNAIYRAGARLLDSGAVDGVLLASYGGCFVDEYQDCTREQHQVVSRLANLLPTCVFGDPLQAIFDFRDQQPVDWVGDVYPIFGWSAELLTPWRWKNAKNQELADWLRDVRTAIECGSDIDLAPRPQCVTWTALPTDPALHQRTILGECLSSMNDAMQGNLIVIGDSTSENRRAALAQKLAKQGFVNLEPIGCKTLQAAAKTIDRSVGLARAKAMVGFASKCMTGIDNAELQRALDARERGRRLGQAKFGSLFPLTDAIVSNGEEQSLDMLLQALRDRPEFLPLPVRDVFRHAISAENEDDTSTPDVERGGVGGSKQNATRWTPPRHSKHRQHATREGAGIRSCHRCHRRCDDEQRRYVALTRATRSIRIIAPAERFRPARDPAAQA